MTLGTGAANIEAILFQIGSQRYLLFDFNGTNVTGWTPQLIVSHYAGARTNNISLTIGNGLSFPIYTTDQILASFSEANTTLQEKDYYLELRRRDLDEPIFSTIAKFSYKSLQGDAQELSFTNENQTISITLGNEISGTVAPVDYLDSVSPVTTGSTITLDLNNKLQRIFVLGTISSNKTIALSNSSSGLVFLIRVNCTGAISFTFPSTFRGLTSETRWANSTRILLLTGATATPFEISCTWDGTFWALKATTDYNIT